MIKASDVRAHASSDDVLQRQAIEEHFDDAIRDAEKTGRWPAEVRRIRGGFTTSNIDAVVKLYLASGWSVRMRPTADVIASLTPTSFVSR